MNKYIFCLEEIAVSDKTAGITFLIFCNILCKTEYLSLYPFNLIFYQPYWATLLRLLKIRRKFNQSYKMN